MKQTLLTLRQVAYTLFAFVFFLGLALELTLIGFVLITLGGASDKHKLRYHRILQRHSRFVINHVPGTTFSLANPGGEQFEEPCMIVCNHQSHLDLMAIMALTPRLIIMTKSWVWHNPFYGLVIRYADFFPVTETEDMTRRLERMTQRGYSVMIFPEGTRSKDSRVHRFHKGAFHLAQELGLDIVPVFISGFGHVLPKKGKLLRPGDMTLEILPRISRAEQASAGSCRELTQRVHKLYVNKENEEVHHHR